MVTMMTESSVADQAARDWAMAAHLSALVGLLGNGIGFVLGPLVVWLWKRDDHEFVRDQGLEAVNFQITMIISAIAAFVLITSLIAVIAGLLLLIATAILAVVNPVIAAVQVKRGVRYRYPFSIRMIK